MNYNYSQKNSCPKCHREISNNAKMCRKCADELHSKRMKGKGNPIYGKKRPEMSKRQKGKSNSQYIDGRCNKIYYCIEENCGKKINYTTYKYGSRRCLSCARKKFFKENPDYYKGKKNPNYDNHALAGENSPRYIDGRAKKWKDIRTKCFQRDDYTCTLCKEKGGYLQCHHIINRHECNDMFDINNLITLCRKCHYSMTIIENDIKYNIYKEKFNNYINNIAKQNNVSYVK